MVRKYKHCILLVDDEVSITKAVKRLLRKEDYHIQTASSGAEGLELLKKSKYQISLIISDQRMPQMNGAQFLEKAKALFPNAMRMLLTGYSDMDSIVDAINNGEIHRYITKPWDDKSLILQVRQALEQFELTYENRRLLMVTKEQNEKLSEFNNDLEQKVRERTVKIGRQNIELKKVNRELEQSFFSTVRLMSSIITTIDPELGNYLNDVAQYSRTIAEKLELDEDEIDQIEMAALIHDIGLLGLSKKIWQKYPNELNEDELRIHRSHPVIASVCIESVDKLANVAEIILYHHEEYNGKGFPNGLKRNEIPLGSRILAVAAEYCKVVNSWPKDSHKIFKKAKTYLGELANDINIKEPDLLLREIAVRMIILKSLQQYDPDIASKLKEIVGKEIYSGQKDNKKMSMPFSKSICLSVHGLEAGMVLKKNVRLKDNRLLLVEGTEIKQNAISIVKKMVLNNLLEDRFFVLNQ